MFGGTTYVTGKVNTNLKVSIKINKTSYNSGDTVYVTTNVSGGIEPYGYRLIIRDVATNAWWSPSTQYQYEQWSEYHTTTGGTKEVYIDVQDYHGEYVRSNACTYTVNGSVVNEVDIPIGYSYWLSTQDKFKEYLGYYYADSSKYPWKFEFHGAPPSVTYLRQDNMLAIDFRSGTFYMNTDDFCKNRSGFKLLPLLLLKYTNGTGGVKYNPNNDGNSRHTWPPSGVACYTNSNGEKMQIYVDASLQASNGTKYIGLFLATDDDTNLYIPSMSSIKADSVVKIPFVLPI